MIAICLVAFIASILTFFSGFGLGTLLMPVVALFFPLDVAIAITAIVHLANNIFKLLLVASHAKFSVIIRFGLPAICFAFFGAILLQQLITLPIIYQYQLFTYEFAISGIKLIIGGLILLFVGIELSPKMSNIKFSSKFLPLGGVLSGFLGGLSGHQGAFRSMFLLKAGLSKQQFIATGVIIAVMVDLVRLSVYGLNFSISKESIDWTLVSYACLSAFLGAFLGKKFIQKITIESIQKLVSIFLISIAVTMIIGLI